MKSFPMTRRFGLILAAATALSACAVLPWSAHHAEAAAPSAAAKSDQVVILIGVDGLRPDALERYPDATPNIRALAADGVTAEGMTPAMPSLTFVNFYSLATGLYADHTGIVSNWSYSRKLGRVMGRADHGESVWWGGEPIWVTAEKQGVHTGTMFWLGSEAAIEGVRPSHWLPFDPNLPYADRVKTVLGWLAGPDHPRFLTIYFQGVDSAEHQFGVGTPEERGAIVDADAAVGALIDGVKQLGLADKTNFILVSDHGMANVPSGNIIDLDDFISFDDVFIPVFQGPDGAGVSAIVNIFVKKGGVDAIYDNLSQASARSHFKVYRREHLPARWHMNNPDRTGDVVVVADEGWLLWGRSLVSHYEGGPPKGMHGYDRNLPSMQATFIAEGPRFRDGIVVEPFDNVEVYGMIANILGLKPAKTDGDLSHVAYFMKPAR
ncbi:MAG TPA: ectonucleotide pyrophosphatase/phosphodiesterase [Parvularculaceae bacterium]|nr:ectonucleotide pyrophosphatase/phosphodiesterase [Parvularculaceae bacterium]